MSTTLSISVTIVEWLSDNIYGDYAWPALLLIPTLLIVNVGYYIKYSALKNETKLSIGEDNVNV